MQWCVGQGELETCSFRLKPVATEGEFLSLCKLLGFTVSMQHVSLVRTAGIVFRLTSVCVGCAYCVYLCTHGTLPLPSQERVFVNGWTVTLTETQPRDGSRLVIHYLDADQKRTQARRFPRATSQPGLSSCVSPSCEMSTIIWIIMPAHHQTVSVSNRLSIHTFDVQPCSSRYTCNAC